MRFAENASTFHPEDKVPKSNIKIQQKVLGVVKNEGKLSEEKTKKSNKLFRKIQTVGETKER